MDTQSLFVKIAESAVAYGYHSECAEMYGGMEKDAAIFNPAALKAVMQTMGKSWGKVIKQPINAIKGMTGLGTLKSHAGRALAGNAKTVTSEAWKNTRSGLLPGGRDIANIFGAGTDHSFGRSLKRIISHPIQATSAIAGKGNLVKGLSGNSIYGAAKASRVQGFNNSWQHLGEPFRNLGKVVRHPIQATSAIAGKGNLVKSHAGNPLYGSAREERIKGFQNWFNRGTSPIVAR